MTDEVSRQYAENKAAAERSKAEGTEKLSKGKPTPTQEENDRFALGEPMPEHEDDGSAPEQRTLEAQASPRGGYQTRHVEARPHRPAASPARSE